MDVALLTRDGIIFCEIPSYILNGLRFKLEKEGSDVTLKVVVTDAKGENERTLLMRPEGILIKL